MGAKNKGDIKEYSGVILYCSHLEPLDLQGMHPYKKEESVNIKSNNEKDSEIEEKVDKIEKEFEESKKL